MHNIRSIWWMTRTNISKWSRDLRIILIVILLATLIHMHLSGLINFVHSENEMINFALLPFLTESRYGKILFILPIFILFADAPFIDNNQIFLIMRSNRKNWILSQALYIFITSLCYVLCLAVLSCIFFVPRLDFTNEWGSVLHTLAKTDIRFQLNVLVNFPRKIIDYFSPYQAMFFSLILQTLVINLLGLIIMLINIWSSHRYLGMFFAATLLMFDALIYSSGILTWVSPITWMQLSSININEGLSQPNFYQILLILMLLFCGLLYLIIRRARWYEV
ncbi:hypothetical protein [Fundicoccus culcitae]|uniref:ABC-2 family transporter protein n=1 Tax=Fundicoccus culcitae TaxID=2969821 RepID=A0ABY5P6H8_9LACT|nr:hypothetical protein [Fundicoccus culcitae]UUX34344.1 hypothetical protein NRE15_01460 [Fundicoccus culcitae]